MGFKEWLSVSHFNNNNNRPAPAPMLQLLHYYRAGT